MNNAKQELLKLAAAGGESPRMLDYYEKQGWYYVMPIAGGFFADGKPRIETRFCFGHGQNGITTEAEQDSANNMARHARTSEDFFILKNLKDVNKTILYLKFSLAKLQGKHEDAAAFDVPYWVRGCWFAPRRQNLPLFAVDFCEVLQPQEGRREATEDEIKSLIKFYEKIKDDFFKRLKTYLKRYGLSKIHSWSYLVD